MVGTMIKLESVVAFLDEQTRRSTFVDFPGAENGLQVDNSGSVSRIGAAVDAGQVPFEQAVKLGVDLLIVHHGLYWTPPQPLTGTAYQKIRTAITGNLAVYSSHLPLDAHPEIGNNACIARLLELEPIDTFLPYEGNPIALIARPPYDRATLRQRLQQLFPETFSAIEFGSERPSRIAILSGSGSSAIPYLKAAGCDTLITGELKQQFFNTAQEEQLNLYPCGHYATEVFGVQALARKAASHFKIPVDIITTGCPL